MTLVENYLFLWDIQLDMEANGSLDKHQTYERHTYEQQQLLDNLGMCPLFLLADMFGAVHNQASNLHMQTQKWVHTKMSQFSKNDEQKCHLSSIRIQLDNGPIRIDHQRGVDELDMVMVVLVSLEYTMDGKSRKCHQIHI